MKVVEQSSNRLVLSYGVPAWLSGSLLLAGGALIALVVARLPIATMRFWMLFIVGLLGIGVGSFLILYYRWSVTIDRSTATITGGRRWPVNSERHTEQWPLADIDDFLVVKHKTRRGVKVYDIDLRLTTGERARLTQHPRFKRQAYQDAINRMHRFVYSKE